jgi:hypothetical protein
LNDKTSVNINAGSIDNVTSSTANDVNTMLSNIAEIGLDGNWNVTLSDTSLSTSEVKTINDATSGTIIMLVATTISGSTADVLEIVNNTGGVFVTAANYAVTLSDTTATAANIKSINDDNGTGTIDMAAVATITISSIADVLEIVNNTGSAFTTATDYTVTLSDTTASAANIKLINDDNGTGTIKMAAVTTITSSSTADVLEIVNNTGSAFSTATDYAVTLSDTASAADANTIMNDTTGIVTATVTATGTVADLNTALSNATANDALTLVLDATSASAADLNTLNGKTSVNINAGSIADVTSSTAVEVNTMVTAGAAIGLDGDWNVVLSDTSLSAAEVKTINAGTSGAINMAAVTTISSSSTADVLEIVNNTGATFTTATDYAVTLSDTASSANLATIDADTTGLITVTTTSVGSNAGYVLTTDLAADGTTNLADFTGLTTIDASEAGDAAMTITAADIFAANDSTGDISLTVTGTNGGADTLSLVGGWALNGMNPNAYQITGDFDGIAGDETYTVNVTDVSVTI